MFEFVAVACDIMIESSVIVKYACVTDEALCSEDVNFCLFWESSRGRLPT